MVNDITQAKLALELIRLIFAKMPIPYHTTNRSMISKYLNSGHVTANFIRNLEEYYNNAKKNKRLDKEKHSEELKERFEFLMFELKLSDYRLNIKTIEKFWEIFVSNPVTPEDSVIFYRLFNEIISSDRLEDCVESIPNLCKFFFETMCDEKRNFSNLTQEGMKAMELLLIVCNMNAK